MQFETIEEVLQQSNALIVEDDLKLQQEIYFEMLKYIGSADVASDGTEALKMYREKEYSAVLTNMNMPGLNGIELINAIRTENRKQLILVVSASEDKDYFIELINLGVDQFIPKPVDFTLLKSVLYDSLKAVYLEQFLNRAHEELKGMRTKLQLKNATLETTVSELENKNKELRREIVVSKTKIKQLTKLIMAYRRLKTDPEEAYEEETPLAEPEINRSQFAQPNYVLEEHRIDLNEIENTIDKIINMMLVQSEPDGEHLYELGILFRRYSNILFKHHDFDMLSGGIMELSQMLLEVKQSIVSKHKNLVLEHLESFVYTLIRWRKEVFSGDIDNIHFYDHSMIVDLKTVNMALADMLDEGEGDMNFV